MEDFDMEQKNVIKECNIAQDGVCAMHGVEVERRQNAQKLTDKIPFLLSAINKIIGFQTILSLVIVASFIYTRDVSQTQAYHERTAKDEFSKLTESMNSLKIVATRSEERYVAVLRELETLNRQVSILISSTQYQPQRQQSSKGDGR